MVKRDFCSLIVPDSCVTQSVFAALVCSLLWAIPADAQHQHEHGTAAKPTKPVERPRVFLDKSPRVVAYQLKRLDNERLLLVERKTDDPKYAPVYRAILTRAGMSPQYREEALDGLVAVNDSNAVAEVIAAVDSMKPKVRQDAFSAGELTSLLLSRDTEQLAPQAEAFKQATSSKNELVRRLGYAGLISIDESKLALAQAENADSAADWMNALSVVPSAAMRNRLGNAIAGTLEQTEKLAEKKAAITALGYVTENQDATFDRLAMLLSDERLRNSVVKTLLKIPSDKRGQSTASACVKELVEFAENTPAAERTSDSFLDAMQLADQLFARLPVEDARSYRQRLGKVTVRVVKIHTVEEEMRYDIPYFAVEAGRDVQVVLVNEDLMPHNLVITAEGSLKEVADLGLAVGPNNGHQGKQYVPDSDKVLFATNMVPPAKSERLTFTAPTKPGAYPYVCTFPRHWMRMYGVMLVVDDLDAWLQNPVAPADPLGSTRSYVKSWTVDDLRDGLSTLSARSKDAGAKHFTEATCAQCHKANGEGGAVGPSLNGAFARWKGDSAAVLREILEPSHRIDPKYAVHLIVTEDGETISGIVAKEDKKNVSILANPESKELTIVPRSSIEEMVKTSTSMMPKGLLDRYNKEEILDLLAYLSTLEELPAAK